MRLFGLGNDSVNDDKQMVVTEDHSLQKTVRPDIGGDNANFIDNITKQVNEIGFSVKQPSDSEIKSIVDNYCDAWGYDKPIDIEIIDHVSELSEDVLKKTSTNYQQTSSGFEPMPFAQDRQMPISRAIERAATESGVLELAQSRFNSNNSSHVMFHSHHYPSLSEIVSDYIQGKYGEAKLTSRDSLISRTSIKPSLLKTLCELLVIRHLSSGKLDAPVQTVASLFDGTHGFLVKDEIAYVLRNPIEINLNADGIIHSTTSPSIRFANGDSIYTINGVDVPGEWVEGNTPDLLEILKWKNQDQRNAACELVGWDKILEVADSKLIDEHDNPQIGQLLRVTLPDTGPELFIKAQCGTGRPVAMCVTASKARTAQDAQNWIWSMPNGVNYQPEIRT